jgi:two-component system, chemotaxis family, chemotaxis protein CheY
MVECLLIERNTAERQRLAALLSELGLDCAQRAMTEDAIAYCRQRAPEVIIMEASVLDSTSEFLRRIAVRPKGAGQPIIILYADRPDVDAVVQSIHDGAAEFLARPFDRDLLKFKLEQAGVLKQ